MKNIRFLVGSLRQHSLNARLTRMGAANLIRAVEADAAAVVSVNGDAFMGQLG